MQREWNKLLIHQVYDEALNCGNINLIDTLFSSSFVDHSTSDQMLGPQGVKDYFVQVREGFPNMHVTIDDLIVAENTVVVRTTWRGTHQGVYEGVEPTGKGTIRTLIQIFRIVDNQISEEWNEGRGLLEALLS